MSRIKQLLCVAAPVALLSMAACSGGDDDGPDAQKRCYGHGACPQGVEDPINLPEGGEVRLELIRRQDGLGYVVRTHAWFASAQDPDSREFFRDPETWNANLDNPCRDMTSKTIFPNGLPNSRTYADGGASVTLATDSDSFVLERVENLEDYAFDNVFDIGYYADIDPGALTYDAEYAVDVAGGADLPAFTLDDPKLYLPSDYTIDTPDFTEEVVIAPGKELPVLWTDDAPSDDPYLYGFVSFADALGARYFCVGPKHGVMKIPPEVTADLPPTGFIQHGILSHRAVAIEDPDSPLDGRRIDLIGISCQESRFSLKSDDG